MKQLGFFCALLCICLFFTVIRSHAASAEEAHQRQAGKSWPPPRFSANGNGTVTDNLTGLIWLKDADCFGVQDWEIAASLASSLASGQCGLNDGSQAGQWRLPSHNELNDLVNHKLNSSAAWLNQQGFSKVQMNCYWSSTASDTSTTHAWIVDMLDFGGTYKINMSAKYCVWPVRSP